VKREPNLDLLDTVDEKVESYSQLPTTIKNDKRMSLVGSRNKRSQSISTPINMPAKRADSPSIKQKLNMHERPFSEFRAVLPQSRDARDLVVRMQSESTGSGVVSPHSRSLRQNIQMVKENWDLKQQERNNQIRNDLRP